MKFLLPLYFCCSLLVHAEIPVAKITDSEDGWKPLLKADFKPVNGAEDTWKFDDEKQTISYTGYLSLESECSPIQFRNLRIRELP
jgi:hypothetical protein